MEQTNGELIDNMTMDEILNHPEFYRLEVFKGIGGTPDYWQITFESQTQNHPNPTWLTFTNREVITKYYTYYKLK